MLIAMRQPMVVLLHCHFVFLLLSLVLKLVSWTIIFLRRSPSTTLAAVNMACSIAGLTVPVVLIWRREKLGAALWGDLTLAIAQATIVVVFGVLVYTDQAALKEFKGTTVILAFAPLIVSIRIYLQNHLYVAMLRIENKASLIRIIRMVLLPMIRYHKVSLGLHFCLTIANAFNQPLMSLLVANAIASNPDAINLGDFAYKVILVWVVLGYVTPQGAAFVVSKMCASASEVLGRRVAISAGLLNGDPEKLPSIFSQGIAKLQTAWDAVFWQLWPSVIKVITGYCFIASVDPSFAVAMLCYVPLSQSLVLLKSRAAQSSKKYNKVLGEQQLMLRNVIDVELSTRTLQAESFVVFRWDQLASEAQTAAHNSLFWAQTYGIVLAALSWGVYVTGILVLLAAYKSGLFPLDELVAVNGYLYGLISPFTGWANAVNKLLLYSSQIGQLASLLGDKDPEVAAADRTYPRLKEYKAFSPEEEGTDVEKALQGKETPANSLMRSAYSQLQYERAAPDVLVEDVIFSYPGMKTPTLRGLTLRIPASSYVALVGPSGSGKTTLLRLLGRSGDPLTGGRILVGGLTPLAYPFTGFCLQSFQLLYASVRDNIVFGCCYDSDADVERAARAAEIHETIAALPQGYDTVLGTGGKVTLSGGQLARLGLARALCRRPRILLCDEITSPLDAVTEESVLETLRNLNRRQGLTVVLCTHSVRAAASTDQIFVLVDGALGQEPGSYEELVRVVDSPFYKLVKASDS